MWTLTQNEKPKEILYGTLGLGVWTAWICLFGIFETRTSLSQIQQMLPAELAGTMVIDTARATPFIVASYAMLGLLSAWFIWKTGQGKLWARASFLWGFILQTLITIFPPYNLSDIPDIGLQALALYWLYSRPSRRWFDLMNEKTSTA